MLLYVGATTNVSSIFFEMYNSSCIWILVYFFLLFKNDYWEVYTLEFYGLLYGTSYLWAIKTFTNTFISIIKNQQKNRPTFGKKKDVFVST